MEKNDIELYLNGVKLNEIPIKQVRLLKNLYKTYNNIGGNDMMLKTSFHVCNTMYKTICELPIKKQCEIIHEATMIAYNARINAFEHIINYKPSDDLETIKNK